MNHLPPGSIAFNTAMRRFFRARPDQHLYFKTWIEWWLEVGEEARQDPGVLSSFGASWAGFWLALGWTLFNGIKWRATINAQLFEAALAALDTDGRNVVAKMARAQDEEGLELLRELRHAIDPKSILDPEPHSQEEEKPS